MSASRKRFFIEYLRMHTKDVMLIGEQQMAQQCIIFAIREIGHQLHDSTHYFFNPAFDLHAEALGLDPDVLREMLVKAELLEVPFGSAQGETRWAA